MTLLHLLRKARVFYPLTSVYDLLVAGLEELLFQNTKSECCRCDGTGLVDSGAPDPQGYFIEIPCECQNKRV